MTTYSSQDKHKISRAREHTERGDLVAAINVWKELLQEHPADALIWHGLADAFAGSDDVRARQCRQRAEFIENPPPPKKKATPVSKPREPQRCSDCGEEGWWGDLPWNVRLCGACEENDGGG